MRFLVPQGIGDSLWALTKVQSVAAQFGDKVIEVYTNVTHPNSKEEARAAPMLERMSFVDKHGQMRASISPSSGYIGEDSRFKYIQDGWIYDAETQIPSYALMPNQALEHGIRLEDWLPDYPINWDIAHCFKYSANEDELADELKRHIGEYAVFFMGPEGGNTIAGHNRGPIWRPGDWIDLGNQIIEKLGIKIVVVGTEWDLSYWKNFVYPFVKHWIDWVAQTTLPETFAMINRARFVISYQSGVGMWASYMGVPLGIFWRADGDSISPSHHVCFDERMASAWVPPQMIEAGKHLPLIYGRHDVQYIMSEIKRRNW